MSESPLGPLSNVELLTEVQSATDVGDVVKVISRFAKAFGEVQNWRFTRDRETRELKVFIALEHADRHPELAQRLGGALQEGEVCFAIPIYKRLDATSPFRPLGMADALPSADGDDRGNYRFES
jgi:hypothetical protein